MRLSLQLVHGIFFTVKEVYFLSLQSVLIEWIDLYPGCNLLSLFPFHDPLIVEALVQ